MSSHSAMAFPVTILTSTEVQRGVVTLFHLALLCSGSKAPSGLFPCSFPEGEPLSGGHEQPHRTGKPEGTRTRDLRQGSEQRHKVRNLARHPGMVA